MRSFTLVDVPRPLDRLRQDSNAKSSRMDMKSFSAMARRYENAKPKDDLLPPQPSAAEGPHTDDDGAVRR